MPTATQIISGYGMENAAAIVAGAKRAGVPIHIAAALVEMESHGRNYYGGDTGATYKDKGTVTEANFKAFLKIVLAGGRSNGVGVLQITYAGGLKNGKRDGGLFTQAEKEGYRLWIPEDNVAFGLKLLKSYYGTLKSWPRAAIAYNDGLSVARRSDEDATQYARTFSRRMREWENRLKNATEEVVYVPKTWRIEEYDPNKPDAVPEEHGDEEVDDDGDVS